MVVMASGNKTAYAKAMEANKREEIDKRKNNGARRHVRAHGGARCEARKRGGGTCNNVAGMGTTHLGIGRCKFHGGSTPNHRANAVAQEAVLLGAPKEINPLDAILWCIRLTAGEIDFYTEQMAVLEEKEWMEDTMLGKQMHVFARERGIAQERLVRFSKTATDLNLGERAIRLAEQYGNTIARLLAGLLEDLKPFISDEGLKMIPTLIRKHILLAEQNGHSSHADVIVQARGALKA